MSLRPQYRDKWAARLTPEQRAKKYEANRRWNAKNKAYYSERAKRVRKEQAFKDTVNANYRAWYADPANRLLKNMRKRLWEATKGKEAGTLQLVGCSVEELQAHLEKRFEPGMTWDNYGEWHVDHVKPCAEFDLTDPEQQRACFHYTNLQPLWALDNIRKGAAAR